MDFVLSAITHHHSCIISYKNDNETLCFCFPSETLRWIYLYQKCSIPKPIQSQGPKKNQNSQALFHQKEPKIKAKSI